MNTILDTFLRKTVLLGVTFALAACTSSPAEHDPWSALARLSACEDQAIGLVEWVLDVPAVGAAATCESTAASCGEYESCIGLDREAPCTFPGEPRCDGNVAVFCNARFGFETRRDCAAVPGAGLCRVDTNGVPSCVAGSCGASGTRCDGNVLVWCASDAGEVRIDCEGRTCTDAGDGNAGCVDVVQACEDDRCAEDGTVERCVRGVGYVRSRCEDRHPDLACQEIDGAARCSAPTVRCTDGAVECAGDVARVCARGVWIEIPCGEVRGGGCEVEGDEIRCVVRG